MKIVINGESADVSTTGLPLGGTIGQVLTKQSNDDGDANWSDIPKSGVSVDAYTTEDEWYVRKYSDGYVEMMKKIYVTVPSSSWVVISPVSLYLSKSVIVPQVFPFALVKKYYENCVLMGCDWWGGFIQSTGDVLSDFLSKSNDYSLIEYGLPSRNLSISAGIYVAGMWKNPSLLSENSIDFVSASSSATLGEISI